jgi:hypothetical protein
MARSFALSNLGPGSPRATTGRIPSITDVLVQRGTIHNWVNRSTKPCAIAFVLIDAKPVEVDGRVLNAEG